jgi:hypothetical protein
VTSLLLAAVILAVGYALGRATATRQHVRLLRDVCHYDAADLIDQRREGTP